MSRIISLAALGLLLILAVVSFPLLAAEKVAKESAAEAKARQDVKAALRAEAEGDNSQRAERLTALWQAPDLAEANWHLAKVRSGQQWLRLADVEQQAASDAQLAEYRKLRDEAEGSPKLLRGLARWCLKNGWHDTARLHYAQLLGRSDIDEETAQEAIKRMELHHVGGKWVTADELKAQEERTLRDRCGLATMAAALKRLELAIDGDEYALRERAIKELQAIDDPHAIIAIESFLLDGGDRFCEEAAKALARFPQIEATEALVHFAVVSPFAGARSAAGEGLKNRPKHDYMPLLLSGLTSPITMRFSMSPGSRGMIQFTHTLVQEKGSRRRVVDVRNQVAYPFVWHPLRRTFSPGRPLVSSSDLVLIAANAAQQAAQELELQTNAVNQESAVRNRPIFDVLEKVADAQLPRDANQWVNWWQDYNQYHWPQQTYYTYQQRPTSYFAGIGMSCFVAGTVVRTQTGMAPIESLKAGDRVLAQNQDSGELSYKLVLRTTIRPPAKMIRIKAGSEQITATLGHPFWVDGHGWKMAKELSASDLLHSLQGAVRIDSIEPAGEDKAYNLVVDDFNTYFVGQQGLLVHDNEFRKPTRAIVPGLIEEAVDLEKK